MRWTIFNETKLRQIFFPKKKKIKGQGWDIFLSHLHKQDSTRIGKSRPIANPISD